MPGAAGRLPKAIDGESDAWWLLRGSGTAPGGPGSRGGNAFQTRAGPFLCYRHLQALNEGSAMCQGQELDLRGRRRPSPVVPWDPGDCTRSFRREHSRNPSPIRPTWLPFGTGLPILLVHGCSHDTAPLREARIGIPHIWVCRARGCRPVD